MELGTFGAILRFAMEWEERAAAFYEQGASGGLQALFPELAQGARRRLRKLEQARREGVAEMILEPIRGLDGRRYRVELAVPAEEGDLLRQARALEEAAARFYGEAAARLPIREVSRLFRQLAQENEGRRQRLEAGPAAW